MLAIPAPVPTVACRGRSHVGLVRRENEDAFGTTPDRTVAVVADGMGGHENGRYVADRAVSALCRLTPGRDLEATLARACALLEDANAEVFARSQQDRKRMGATMVAAIFDRSRVGILWAGDSRAYVFRRGVLYPLTRDHSAVQDLLDAGKITPMDAPGHPMRHVVTRALGAGSRIDIARGTHALAPEDIILLATDGLHGAVSDEQIAACLDRFGLAAVDALIDMALAAGGRDNVTVMLLQV